MSERRFPVLRDYRLKRSHPDCPESIAWDLIAPHARQAERNHSQSLETLARRGGLDPLEMRAVLEDRPFPLAVDYTEAQRLAVEWLRGIA